jgi:transposase
MKREMYYEEVIRLHEEEGYGVHKIAEVLPLGHSTVWRWIRKFAAENKVKTEAMASTKKTKRASAEFDEGDEEIQSLKAELSALRDRLRQAEMRADLYDEIITVAEKRYKVEIRKKAGAKQ